MPFPFMPHANEPESDFLIQDPFGLRKTVTPVFIQELTGGLAEGCGTSFYINPFGHQISAMHIITDFFNERKAPISTRGPTTLNIEDALIGILHDPGLVYGMRPAGKVLYADKFCMFPVDQASKPNAIVLTPRELAYVEPMLDLASWDIVGPHEDKTVFLPVRIGCAASVKEGDRVMAVGYPRITTRQGSGPQLVAYQEEMRGSIGKIIKTDRTWIHDRKIWPTIVVDVRWASGMSGGPVFNENGEVVGIVSRSVDADEGSQSWSSALWLEALPYHETIFEGIDRSRPGWIHCWAACNTNSVVEIFRTREEAQSFGQRYSPELSVKYVTTPYRTLFRNKNAR